MGFMNTSVALGKRQLVDSIWKSANIEGFGTTFPSTQAILENLPVMATRDEVYFICNMKRAWDFIFDQIDFPTNLMLLREVNKICLENLSYGEGELRKIPVSIGGTDWAPEMPNSGAIIEDLNNLSKIDNALDRALETFCYIARKQMFIDGNKRVAQIICNKILMENDLGIFSVPKNEIDKFTDFLIKFYETNDNTDIKEFFLDKCLLLTEKGENTKCELMEKMKDKDDRIP